MEEPNVGDVVGLKSGGPPMTIEKIQSDNTIICIWFREGEIYRKSFVKETSEKRRSQR